MEQGIDLPLSVVREALARGVHVRVRLRGRSMHPAIEDGEQVEIHPIPGSLRQGDVVAFVRTERLTVHRVVSVWDTTLITRGDARPTADAPVPHADVLGVVTRGGGAPLPGLGLRRRLRALLWSAP